MDKSNQEMLQEAQKKLELVYKEQKFKTLIENNNDFVQSKSKLEDMINMRVIKEKISSKFGNEAEQILKYTVCKSSVNINKRETFTQTESFELKKLEDKIKQLEKKLEVLNKEKEDLILENKIINEKVKLLSEEVEEKRYSFKSMEDNLISINKSLYILRDENFSLRKEKEDYLKKESQNNNLLEEYEKLKTALKEGKLNGFYRNSISNRKSIQYDRRLSTDGLADFDPNKQIKTEPPMVKFFSLNLIRTIVKYLTEYDIANLKLVNTTFLDSLESDVALTNDFLMKIIKKKNSRIIELSLDKHNKYANITEIYNTNTDYVERLIKKYIFN